MWAWWCFGWCHIFLVYNTLFEIRVRCLKFSLMRLVWWVLVCVGNDICKSQTTLVLWKKNMMEVQGMLGKTRCPVGAGSANCSNKAADKVLTVNEELCWEVISWWTVILLRCDILMVSAPLWKGMLAGPQLHAGIGLAVYARCVVERMSMAEELPGKAKQGSCTINYLSKVFSTWPKWNAWNELFWVVILFMVEYDNSLRIMIVGKDNGLSVDNVHINYCVKGGFDGVFLTK